MRAHESSAAGTTATATATVRAVAPPLRAEPVGLDAPPPFALPSIQRKPSISAPDDPFEREADAVADQVMRMADPTAISAAPPAIQRSCAACAGERDDEDPPGAPGGAAVVQRKPAGAGAGAGDLHAIIAQGTSGGGRMLDDRTRSFMEARFHRDFSAVRVHTGSGAAQSARAVDAIAYTVGRDIVFAAGAYAPHSDGGRRLLAHELTHTVQQGAVGGAGPARGSGAAIAGRGDQTIARLAAPRISGGAGALMQRSCSHLLANPSIMSVVSGSAVHTMIQTHFSRVSGALTVMIPGASAAPLRTQGLCGDDTTVIAPQIVGGRAGAGYPDLATLRSGVLQVAEIKPANVLCLIDGEQQLAGYIGQGNATDAEQVAWRLGMGIATVVPMAPGTYSPPTFALPGGFTIRTAWCNPGMMVYSVTRNGVTVPVPVRVTVTREERDRERQRQRDLARARGVLVPVAVAGGAAVAVAVARRAAWRHFWQAVISRFAVRGAVAAGLAAVDGPLPFGEIVDIGIGVATAVEIVVVWDDLWRDAEDIAAREA